MKEKILKRIKNDKANAVIVLGLMLIAASLLVGGMLLDLSKAYQFKASYTEAAQKATQSGIRIQSTEGYLTYQSVLETIRVYEFIARPSIMKVDSTLSACGEPRKLSIILKTEDGRGELQLPEVNLDNQRMLELRSSVIANTGAYNTESTMNEIDSIYGLMRFKSAIDRGKFNTIQVKIYEATPNFVLPGAIRATGENGDAMMCQKLGIAASASQFIGDEDGGFN